MYKIALVRSTSYKVKNSQYNVQEIGLANELSKLGMEVDVYIFSDTGETYIEKCGKEDRVTVYWMKGISIPGRQAYYKELNKFLSRFYNTNLDIENSLKWEKESANPVELAEIIGIFVDNSDDYVLNMWLSLDKDIFVNVTSENADSIIRYLYERFPY